MFYWMLISTLTSENSVFSKMMFQLEIQELSIQANLNVIFLYLSFLVIIIIQCYISFWNHKTPRRKHRQ